MDTSTLAQTDFSFTGQTEVYHGKVRDVYSIGPRLISVATDRISAFDVILPRAIPYKGQVLNQLAAHFLKATQDILPNWLEATPDPVVSIGKKAVPFKVEVVIRASLVGYSWRQYQSGARVLCGVALPEDMQEYDQFPEPIITPSTKADAGHDEDISSDEIVSRGLASASEWQQLADYARKLFNRGQVMSSEQGLILADTKYEFGKLDGDIILIDEIHTPDSSRYFYKASYEAFLRDRNKAEPKHLSKEFVREWLMEHGFSGQAGQRVPDMDDIFVKSVSERYIELFEQLAGKNFEKANNTNIVQRVENNVSTWLKEH